MLITQLDKHCTKQPGDMKDWYNFCTFDIIGELAFGEPFGSTASGTYWTKFSPYWTDPANVCIRRASLLDNRTFRKLENNLIPPRNSVFPTYWKFVRFSVQKGFIAKEGQGAKKEADSVL